MKGKKIGCLVLALLLLACSLALCACGVAGRYTGELGGEYKITASSIRRLDVPVSFTAGGSTIDASVDIVYMYDLEEQEGTQEEKIIHMYLKRVLYNGENEYVQEQVDAINQSIEQDEDFRFYYFGNLKLAKQTSGSFSAGDGYIKINGERLSKK